MATNEQIPNTKNNTGSIQLPLKIKFQMGPSVSKLRTTQQTMVGQFGQWLVIIWSLRSAQISQNHKIERYVLFERTNIDLLEHPGM